MDKKLCESCGESFMGRANQKYCSTRCKSTVNNARINERDKGQRDIEQKIKANRRILMLLEGIYGNQEFPASIIQNSKLEQHFNTGIKSKERVIQFYDYNLQVLENKNLRIFKAEQI
jgi:hypothetical protein